MATTTATLTSTPRSGRIGADVHGIDLREPLAAGAVEQIRALLAEHLVLFFPEQHLDDDQQLAFTLRFGDPYVHPLARGADRPARCEHIVDDVEHPPYQDKWHTDVSWDSAPPTFATLRAIDLPSRGGDTIWASMYAAHDALSPLMQSVIAPLTAIHTMGSAVSFVSKAGAEVVERTRQLFPGSEHPVVAVHPDTGRRYLNVNREFTDRIAGMSGEESRALLDLLTAQAMSPNVQLRHSWTVGDVVLWDERPTQHFAVADYVPERREMGRVAVRVVA